MTFSEYASFDAMGLAELVRTGGISPAELVETAIARIEALNPRLNAVIHPMFDRARREAGSSLPDGPFRGVPFLLKDLSVLVAGVPMRAGSRFLDGWIPDHDSELVIRFRNAGLVTLGKTSTPELGLTPYTEPELFGPTRNPWNTERISGGSSGGSAAAVASRMVPIAGGGDGGGSIRRGHEVRRPHIGSRHRIECRRAVAHRPGEHVVHHAALPQLAAIGTCRRATARRLHAEEAAA